MKQFIEEVIRYIRIFIIRVKVLNKKSIDLFSIDTVVVISPHPDDEVLGCAGIIRRCISLKKQVYVIIMTRGELCNIKYCSKEETIKQRSILTVNAMRSLGLPLSHLFQFKFPDCGIKDRDDDEMRKLYELLDTIKPDTVLIPHPFDRHGDHIASGNILKEYCKEKKVIKIYEYCVWFWFWFRHSGKIQWKNAQLLGMTLDEHNLKEEAMDAYFKPLAPFGKPWPGLLPKSMLYACKWRNELFFYLKY